MYYPQVYHNAVRHLVVFGGHSGDRKLGRLLIAQALRTIRARHGGPAARRERRHMLFIAGHFPVK